MEHHLRRSGIELLGDIAWGSHLCLFYDTPEDLIDTHAGYFGAGLEDGENCVWAVSEPVDRDAAIAALRPEIPHFDRYLASGQMEIVPGYQWYMPGGKRDRHLITAGWHAKLAEALKAGFSGLRVSGNAFWFEAGMWTEFRAYEEELEQTAHDRRMIVLCTYSLHAARAVDLLDVVRMHQFSLARRSGHWEFLETPELAQAKREIGRLNAAIDLMSRPNPRLSVLTPRERVVLAQVIKGASAKETARDLAISPRTVEFHRANIMRKLGARNVAALIGKVLGPQ